MRRVKNDPNIRPEDLRRENIFIIVNAVLFFLFLLIWVLIYSVLDALIVFGFAFFILLPSFFTNAAMVLTGKIKGIPRFPIDGGRMHKDGERILGDGKSWNGFIGGWIVGFTVSVAISWWIFARIYEADQYQLLSFFTQDSIRSFISSVYDLEGLHLGIYLLSQGLIALGSPVGDMMGSYVKRRRHIGRGSVFLFVDQNDFIILSALVSLFFFPFTWYYWLVVLTLTPLLTAFSNWIGYLMYKKDVPW